MIINSPVGRFPFEVERLSLTDGRIRLEGAMGTWPTSVEIDPRELPRLAWRLLGARGAAALGVPAALAILLLAGARGRG